MSTLQLDFFRTAPPVPTIMVKLADGSLVEGIIGPRSTCWHAEQFNMDWGARNGGWRPDPKGKWFCIDWLVPESEESLALSRRLGLPEHSHSQCGVYVHEDIIARLLESGEPWDQPYRTQQKWDAMMQRRGRRSTEDNDGLSDDDELDEEGV